MQNKGKVLSKKKPNFLSSIRDIKVKDKDVKFLAKELDIDDLRATTLLRQNEANLQKAIKNYIHN